MRKFTGFTLAEVLITLGVIGVVAAITLPALMTNITGYVNTKRQENIGQKVTKAMETMRAHGLLNTQYATTDAFVDELQKYLKISKRCDSAHIADCWPTPVVTTGDGEEYEVSQATTGKHLSLESESDNVGLILADGAPIILNYNPEASAIDVGDRVEKVEGIPYTTTVTGAIDFVMDVNGSKSPNSEKAGNKRDIRPFKTASFTKVNTCEGGVNVPGVGCVVKLGSYYNWQGAIDACKAKGMHLAGFDGNTRSGEIVDIFNKNCTKRHSDCISELPTSFWFWSSAELDPSTAWGKGFDDGAELTPPQGRSERGLVCR